MIIKLSGADFSANNIGIIDLRTGVTSETQAILDIYGKTTWSLSQKLSIEDFFIAFNSATWKSKIKHLILPILAPPTTDIVTSSTSKFAYNHATGLFAPVTCIIPDAFNVIVANGFKRLEVGPDWGPIVKVSTGATYPDPVNGMHMGAFYKNTNLAVDSGKEIVIWADYYALMSQKIIEWGNTTLVRAVFDTNLLTNEGFRIISLGNGTPIGTDCGYPIPSITGTATDESLADMKYNLLSLSGAPVNTTTELALVSFGYALTQLETSEYNTIVSTLMDSLWTN